MKSLQVVSTQFADENTPWEPQENGEAGCLADVALKVLMKVLYVARMARLDLLRATCLLARRLQSGAKNATGDSTD